MLERATGCLENAGRRVLRKSNRAIRHKSFWCQGFSKANCAGTDVPHWFLALLQASSQQSSTVLETCNEDQRGKFDGSQGLLPEYLCPRILPPPVASRLSHSQRRPEVRRRTTFLDFSRSFISVSSLHQAGSLDSSSHENEQEKEKPRTTDSLEQWQKDYVGLHKLLQNENGHFFDQAWKLFVRVGRPCNLQSALCAYLSRSKYFKNTRRTWYVFQEISPENRTQRDYENVIHSQFLLTHINKPPHLDTICAQVVSMPFAEEILSLVVNHHIKNRKWAQLRSLWHTLAHLPRPKRRKLSQSVLHQITRRHFPEYDFARHLLALASYAKAHSDDVETLDFTRHLINRFVFCEDFLKLTPTLLLIDLLKEYSSLGLLDRYSYVAVILTFLHGDKKDVVKSILFYRQFRLDMPDDTPPKSLLNQFMDRLLIFQMPETMDYFLDENAKFVRGGVSLKIYGQVLTAFSRAVDAKNVHRIYDRMIKQHGNPRSRRLISPVLSVHARLGDVPETLRQFQRISAEFDLTPNTVCWNILILAYVTAGDLPGTLSVYSQLLESGEPPNSHTFGTLLPLFSKRGDTNNVHRLIKEAQNRGIMLTAPILDTAVHVYCSNGQLGLAENLAEASANLGDGSSLRKWNIILMHYARRISKYSFRRVLDRIGKLGLTPDAMTHAAIMLAYSLSNQPDLARKAFRRMHRMGLPDNDHHWSILLLGYLKRRNRDMVHVIFREMEIRFGRTGLNANLSRLKMQIKRDLENIYDQKQLSESMVLVHAEKTLIRSIQNFNRSPSSVKHGAPLSGQGSALDSSTTAHYQNMITSYAVEGNIEQAFTMLNKYLSERQPMGTPVNDLHSLPFGFVKALMIVYQKSQQFDEVEKCWHVLWDQAHNMAGNVDLGGVLSDSTSESGLSATGDLEKEPEGQILHAHRFILDMSFSFYIRSLACREEFEKIHQEVAGFQSAGFALSSVNWSNYIAALASSNDTNHIMKAFEIFEEKFSPYFPGWVWMKRGYGIRPNHCPVTIHHLDGKFGTNVPRRMMGPHARRHWTKIEPDYMHPHYPTMVLLAAASRRLLLDSIKEGSDRVRELREAAPNTFKIISRMPHLSDRYQGALLRQLATFPDPIPLPIKLFTTRSGALGLEREPKTRTFAQATKEPLNLEILPEPNPVDEKNITQLLSEPERNRLGSLATVLPRSDRIAVEQQTYEYRALRKSWAERLKYERKLISKAKRKTKGMMHGLPARAVLNWRRLKKQVSDKHFFDKYFRRWKLKRDSYLLFKPISGLEEKRKYRIYSRKGMKIRGLGRRRTKRQETPHRPRKRPVKRQASRLRVARMNKAVDSLADP